MFYKELFLTNGFYSSAYNYTGKWPSLKVKEHRYDYYTLINLNYTVFYKRRLFSTWPQCCLTFLWIELQILLSSCLIHIAIIIVRHILYILYSCPCLGLGLFTWYICDLCFISSLIFIAILTSFKQTSLFLVHFLKKAPIIFGW